MKLKAMDLMNITQFKKTGDGRTVPVRPDGPKPARRWHPLRDRVVGAYKVLMGRADVIDWD